ncbi:hypothetical protein FDP41_010435 [Naegleria fowleri]|uniref:RGS domain-containing protein n=1 Tax=Naegleria fowleri TaxID=5763 RepID=A0A6A5CCP1_NAEFO|nr:uncharacterized protein FDP41_010435 [Naegleria fowleri]KAF0983370.1 hypothetical protein FDP41_010435 [Naegleria fowleri]
MMALLLVLSFSSHLLVHAELTLSIETISIEELATITENVFKESPSATTMPFHIIQIHSPQVALAPKLFNSYDNQSALSEMKDTKSLVEFVHANELFDSMRACCTDNAFHMMESWNFTDWNYEEWLNGQEGNGSSIVHNLKQQTRSQMSKTLTIEKKVVSPIGFYSKLENEHWLLDTLWAFVPIISLSMNQVDHLLLNFKNNLLLNSTNFSTFDHLKFADYVQLLPTNGATSVTILKTVPQVTEEELWSQLSDSQQHQIVEALKEDIQTSILNPILHYPAMLQCNITNSTTLNQMREYHLALLRKSTGMGYISARQWITLQAYTYFALPISYVPYIPYTNEFLWRALKILYEQESSDFKKILSQEGFDTSNTFNETLLIAEFEKWKKDAPSYVSSRFMDIYCYSSYNNYLGMFHYNFYDAYQYFMFKDGILYCISALAILFYVGFIATFVVRRRTKNIVLKRRLLLPYVGPVSLFLLPLYFLEPIWNRQYIDVFHTDAAFASTGIYPNLFISLFFSTYCVTVLRFYHLKNLYWIMNKFASKKYVISDRALRINKFLTSKVMAFVFTLILSSVIFLLWVPYYVSWYGESRAMIFSAYNLQVELLFLVPFSSLIILLSIICIICLIIDLIVNRKKIRQKGVVHYFIFDDPFFLRIDLTMMLLTAVVSALIYMTFSSATTNVVSKALFLLLFILCYLVTGGNAIIIELLRGVIALIRGGKKEESEFTKMINDPDFRNIFRMYSVNEHSVENLVLYELLETFMKKGELTEEEMHDIDRNFLRPFSPFEINMSSEGKKKFAELMMKNKGTKTTYASVDEILMKEILLNMSDTIARLEMTPEYMDWLKTKQLKGDIELGFENK